MLSLLRIQNLAIIDNLELELGPGLNVLTGETGAGKSILVGALKLVLGGKPRPEMVRTGAESAVVEALFDIGDNPRARARLEAEGIEAEGDGEVVVRRIIGAGGRSRAFVNGKLTTADQLSRLAVGLVDISSQHQHHSLVDEATHIDYLDAFAEVEAERAQVGLAHAELVAAVRALKEAEAAVRSRAEREQFLRFQLEDVRKLDPKPGEEEALHQEGERLRHAERLSQVTSGGEKVLHSGNGAVCEKLRRLAVDLRDAAKVEPSLEGVAGRVESARLELQDAAQELGRKGRNYPEDPRRLAEIEDRTTALRRLLRRHGPTLEALLEWRAGAEAELAALSDGDLRVEEAERALRRVRASASEVAHALSLRRQAAATALGDAITAELNALGMGGARVEVAVAPTSGASDVEVDGARLTATGIDRVEFLIAPNPGEAPRPLRQVASGGELSRSLLALKRVLSGLGPVGLYVFDEVDTGVGGAVAEVIGRKLAEVADGGQVLCITHLPQVAAWADRHLRVHKAVVDGRTQSGVEHLDSHHARREELARMLGGVEVGDGARENAEDMLAIAARRARPPSAAAAEAAAR